MFCFHWNFSTSDGSSAFAGGVCVVVIVTSHMVRFMIFQCTTIPLYMNISNNAGLESRVAGFPELRHSYFTEHSYILDALSWIDGSRANPASSRCGPLTCNKMEITPAAPLLLECNWIYSHCTLQVVGFSIPLNDLQLMLAVIHLSSPSVRQDFFFFSFPSLNHKSSLHWLRCQGACARIFQEGFSSPCLPVGQL